MSQLRALFDGEMTKHSGSMDKPLHWKGYLGIIAGSTPSVYPAFEEYSDLGERFIYYRMKEFDAEKATHVALSRKLFGSALNDTLSEAYAEYIETMVKTYAENDPIELSQEVKNRLAKISKFSEDVRTAVHKDWRGEKIDRIPTPAYPMRVALQLVAIARALSLMRHNECGSYELIEEDLTILDWIGYSLANEEKRACLRVFASTEFETSLSTQAIADVVGLDTSIVGNFLQNLSAVKVLKRTALGDSLRWEFASKDSYDLVRRIESIKETVEIDERDVTTEELDTYNEEANQNFDREF